MSHNLPKTHIILPLLLAPLTKLLGFAVCVGLGWWITDGILTQIRLFRLTNSNNRKD